MPNSVPAPALRLAAAEDRMLASGGTLMELVNVLCRPKFDPFVTVEERQTFLRLFGRIAEPVPIIRISRGHAERDARHGDRHGVLPVRQNDHWHHADPGDDGWAG